MEWIVRIETASPDDYLDFSTAAAHGAMLERLGSCVEGGRIDKAGWDATVMVDGATAGEAMERGITLIMVAAQSTGVPAWQVVDQQVVVAELQWYRESLSVFPEIAGACEVVEMLGVTEQRLSQLRREGRFPVPITNLAATPVWLRSEVEEYVICGDRSPGLHPWPLNMLDVADEITLIRATPDPQRPNQVMIGIWLDEDHESEPKAMHPGVTDGARRLATALEFAEFADPATNELWWLPTT